MNEGIKKKIIRDITLLENYLTEHQDEMIAAEIDEVLEQLDELYELLKMFQ